MSRDYGDNGDNGDFGLCHVIVLNSSTSSGHSGQLCRQPTDLPTRFLVLLL
ncbi:MAG TPA: hypothetical protein VE054_03645 [Blattabacteriaceae bacterium]|jgi:hypothetical protein|nr:hypothetical protein [Blattabacteriaceae bacterium]